LLNGSHGVIAFVNYFISINLPCVLILLWIIFPYSLSIFLAKELLKNNIKELLSKNLRFPVSIAAKAASIEKSYWLNNYYFKSSHYLYISISLQIILVRSYSTSKLKKSVGLQSIWVLWQTTALSFKFVVHKTIWRKSV
jgi:hypothetical protein